MKVLLLCSDNPECEKLRSYIISCGDELFYIKITSEKAREINPDIMVSYNYRYILKPDVFSVPARGAINLHISYLPWNRGADPNFWSHLDETPKGVTIHYIDFGIDTGDIIGQELVEFSDGDTLRSSYAKLHSAIQELFERLWQKIKTRQVAPFKQQGEGTFHLSKDKEAFKHLVADKGHDTPIKEIKKF